MKIHMNKVSPELYRVIVYPWDSDTFDKSVGCSVWMRCQDIGIMQDARIYRHPNYHKEKKIEEIK